MSQAVSESLPLKQKIFGDLAEHCAPSAILATNTSSISVSKIAASAVKRGTSPEEQLASSARFLSIHWMVSWAEPPDSRRVHSLRRAVQNPVPQMKLVGAQVDSSPLWSRRF